MAKRIPISRVIRSKPLGKSRNAGTSHNFHTRIGDIHGGSTQGKSTSGSVIYTRVLEITRMSKYNELGCRMLDCYV